MKLSPEQSTMITPRVPVIGHLRTSHASPEIWPLKAVLLMIVASAAVYALCALAAHFAPIVTERVMQHIDEVVERMDEEQAARAAELEDEKGDPL